MKAKPSVRCGEVRDLGRESRSSGCEGVEGARSKNCSNVPYSAVCLRWKITIQMVLLWTVYIFTN